MVELLIVMTDFQKNQVKTNEVIAKIAEASSDEEAKKYLEV